MGKKTWRIQPLRQSALDQAPPGIRSRENQLNWYRGWLKNRDAASHLQRTAAAKAYMLHCAIPQINDYELIVGRPCYRQLTAQEQSELAAYEDLLAAAMPQTGGQASHMAIDYEKLLRLGIDGISKEIIAYQGQLDIADPQDLARHDFYQACLIALDGVAAYAKRYADFADEQADACTEQQRKAELRLIAARCRKVPLQSAETFSEALQSVHFVTFCLEGLYQLGRPDRYLLPYYEQDILQGIIDEDSAQELIDCLCLLFNMYIPQGLAAGLMVGGFDAGGQDVTNQLTALFIESIGHTRLSYPGIGLCVTPQTPDHILRQSCTLLAEGLSHPALFNDEVISRGLRGYGLSRAEACSYIHSTCVEITPIACSAVWVASPYINLIQPLLDLMAIPEHQVPGDFEAFLNGYRQSLQQIIRDSVIEQNRLQMARETFGGDPLVSCFVDDCLASGKDVDQGGARYNWIMPSFVGLANLADALVVIRELVYRQADLSMGQLQEILRVNFDGQEAFRQKLLKQIPKYGNDNDQADQLVTLLTSWIVEDVSCHQTWRGDRFIPSLFCWIMHEQLGSRTGATPDGRLAGFPLGDGSGPAQGRETEGPTASILSSTKWPHDAFIGGIAINLKFSRSSFQPASLEKMIALIRTFMARGGFELQLNVVDRETLLKAKKNPEQYRDLVVRVGGYSDYFIHLSPAMQEEVILRSEHRF